MTFNFTWRLTNYCKIELEQFVENSEGIAPEDLRLRYVDFVNRLIRGEIKKSTDVDCDVLETFILDLENRADIDYLENHWEDCPETVKGGKRFLVRAAKLRVIHNLKRETK
tara:strand:+ start:1398 stop:1730 length:333 start_codon:yes stop_codon:yes gene_type:complete